MVAGLAGAVIGGSILGLVVGVVAPSAPPKTKVLAAATSSSPSGSPSVTGMAAAPSPSSRSASPSPTVSVKTVTATPEDPPQSRIERPWQDRTLRFVTLEDIQRDGDHLTMTVTPTTFLTGARAQAYYAKQGQEPKEYAGVPNGRSYSLDVRGDSTVFGEFFLGDHENVNPRQFSRDEIYDYARGALDHGVKPTFWIKRTLGIEGPVIYVAEQYLG